MQFRGLPFRTSCSSRTNSKNRAANILGTLHIAVRVVLMTASVPQPTALQQQEADWSFPT